MPLLDLHRSLGVLRAWCSSLRKHAATCRRSYSQNLLRMVCALNFHITMTAISGSMKYTVCNIDNELQGLEEISPTIY